MSCVFCRIASGEIKSDRLHEDDEVVALRDLNPQAPTHLLVIPRRHVETTNDLGDGDAALAGRLVLVARDLARRLGFADAGYRLVLNCNADGGQSVPHVHLHVLAGRPLAWPPG
jgi:histidine triad (HIT) family protein